MDLNIMYVQAERQYRLERARSDMGRNTRPRLPRMPRVPSLPIRRRLALTA